MSIATLLPERTGKVPGAPSFMTSPLDSALADVIRKIFVGPASAECQAVALIYERQEVGCPLLCASLANMLGELHGKVLAISATDLLSTVAVRPGVSDIDFMKVGEGSVWISPTAERGYVEPSSSDLDKAMLTLRSQFDFLIIDGGPTSEMRSLEKLARYMDGFLMVVREGQTAIRDLVAIRRRLEGNGGRIIGCVYRGSGAVVAGGR